MTDPFNLVISNQPAGWQAKRSLSADQAGNFYRLPQSPMRAPS